MEWISFENSQPQNRSFCKVLILLENENLLELDGKFYDSIGFVLPLLDGRPCGTGAIVTHWMLSPEPPKE